MKISYVILTWNSEKFIENCINSILDIKEIDNDIIIVDNGSQDNTRNLLKNYEKEIKTILLDKNYGTTKSRNMGIKKIDDDSDYVCILDSDTKINKNAIEKMIQVLKENNQIGIVGPKMQTSNGLVQKSGRKFPTIKIKFYKAFPIKQFETKGELLENYDFSGEKAYYEVDYLMSACWLLRKEIIKDVGMFDEKIFYAPEDVDYCARLWQAGYKVVYCKEAQIIHEWQRISKKKLISKMNFEHIKGLIYYFKKYGYINHPEKKIHKKQ